MDEPTGSAPTNSVVPDKEANYDNNETENVTRAALEKLMQEEGKLKVLMVSGQELKRKRREWYRSIEHSNWKLELEVKKLRDETDHLESEILAKSDESQKIFNELEAHRTRNKEEIENFWMNFQEETEKYSHSYTNGHIEYSCECLKQDIEEYRRQSANLRGMIGNIEEEMAKLTDRYGLADSLGTNEQAIILKTIDSAKTTISDKRHLLQATKSAEDNIDVLKLKVKQKKDDIAYLRSRSNKK